MLEVVIGSGAFSIAVGLWFISSHLHGIEIELKRISNSLDNKE